MLSNVENDFIHSIEMLEKIEDSNMSAAKCVSGCNPGLDVTI